MKKADLEKFLGKKVEGAMRRETLPDRYGAASAQVHDKREQRKRDQEAGLVPFAVKLPQAMVRALQERARERSVTLNEVTAELLRESLDARQAKSPAADAKPEKSATRAKTAAESAPSTHAKAAAPKPASAPAKKRTSK
jgi:hypothetical protein